MILRQFKLEYRKFIFIVFACLLVFVANGYTEDEIEEKRVGVAMRMIGHEVLMCLGDYKSRVMPIEKIDNQYKISFENELGFDPDDVISIIENVVTETEVATFCLIEVEQCEKKEVVHAFIIGSVPNSSMIACGGRVLPKDCYSLLITILDDSISTDNLRLIDPDITTGELASSETLLTSSETKESDLLKSFYVLFPLLFLIGFIGYFIKKKKPIEIDPNLIQIGSSRFDKRNMLLFIEDDKIELSNKEADLLSLLHSSVNEPLEREVILQRVWGDEGDYVGRTLDVFISKLRKKLEADSNVKIVNIRGVGYKLVTNLPSAS